ncbi:MAG: glycosyltransferase family 39 protein [Pirellulales bacterium]|nr:glycosyltransferase family 39 protein [Pirellulales bacterium]
MSQNVRNQLWILLAAGCIFFTSLGTAALWDEDETWHASCAREMFERGDWVVPMFNGKLFPEKPPLMFWTMMAGFQLFGASELGARFFSAVFGAAAALVTYHLGRKLFDDRVGFWGGLITASSIIFTVSARAATVDAALVLLTTAAVWCFVSIRGEGRGERGESEDKDAAQFAICNLQSPICNNRVKQLLLFIAFYVLLGLAVLAKGPIGYLLPMAALGLFLMIRNYRPKTADRGGGWTNNGYFSILSPIEFFGVVKRIAASFFVSLGQLRPIAGLIVTLAVALPWYAMVDARTEGEWVRTFINDYCVRRFTQPSLGHGGPFWYYLPAVLIGFFPWSVFLGPTFVEVYRRIRAGGPRRDALVLLCCLFGGWLVFWSICRSKLPHYMLPVYPALSLLTAYFLDGWIAERVQVSRSWMRTTWLSAILAGAGMAVALPIAAAYLLPGEEWIGAIGLLPILGGWLGLHYTARGRRLAAVRCYAVAAAAFLAAAFGFATVGVDRHQHARPMLAEIRRDASGEAAICEYRFHRKSTVYYAGHPVAICDRPHDLKKYLDSSGEMYIITLDEYQSEIERNYPGKFEVLLRCRRFASVVKPIPAFKARPSELVVLKRVERPGANRVAGKLDAKKTH